MKKIYLIAAMAVIALCAIVSTSCSKDKEINDPDTTLGENITFGGSDEAIDQAVTALQNYLQNQVVGNIATVKITKEYETLGGYYSYKVYNTFKQSKLSDVQAAYKNNFDKSKMDEIFKAISGLSNVKILLQLSSSDYIVDYEYQITLNLFGTWKYTDENNTTYALTITQEKDDDDSYISTLTVGGTPYKGAVIVQNYIAMFQTYEKTDDDYHNHIYEVGLTFTPGVEDSASGKVFYKGNSILSKVTFKLEK